MNLFLSEIKSPGTFTVINITGSETTRILEMGITPGIRIEVLRKAPTGYPIEIRVRGGLLSLRETEAKSIELKG
ncbi:MAG: ferrous iron transport protein A [Balneolales bacterium]|nr:ferrous iron transport protein A [Balneolales bacterium]